MDTKKRILAWFISLLLTVCAIAAHYLYDPWGFYWKVSPEEEHLRLSFIKTAQSYLGFNESDGSHKEILEIYNSQDVLPVGYVVQETDSWCSAFVSAMAIQAGLTEIIPAECGCQRHIGLFQDIGRWVEADDHIPAPGDLIFYDWDVTKQGESTGWSDHVGIVVGVKWPFIKVIEGNKDDDVSYRIVLLGDMRIRGFGIPEYTALIK